MNITPKEAQAALNDIQNASIKARNVVNTWAYYMLLWGVVWTVGFLITQFRPQLATWIWIVMVIIGMVGSTVLGIAQGGRVRPAPGRMQHSSAHALASSTECSMPLPFSG